MSGQFRGGGAARRKIYPLLFIRPTLCGQSGAGVASLRKIYSLLFIQGPWTETLAPASLVGLTGLTAL